MDFDFEIDGLRVRFFNRTVFSANAWSWDFGDETESTVREPRHTYAQGGTYTVTLIAICGAKTSKVSKVLKINAIEECYPNDPQPFTPEFNDLINQEALTPADRYGWLGYEAQGEWITPISVLNWLICPFVDFVDGPAVEGQTQRGRYLTRYRIIYDREAGEFRYGRVGDTQQAPDPALGITPISLPDGAQISLGFDSDARACFAYQLNSSQIRITRFVAGVPTNYTWSGINPRLFFDGILQPDLASTDLVCIYINVSGDVCTRMQRDNFGTEYVQFVPSGAPGRRITKVDRYQSYLYVYYTDILGIRRMVRSKVYPPFPLWEVDKSFVTGSIADGEYILSVIDGGSYSDAALISGVNSGGSYDSTIVQSGPYVDEAVVSGTNFDGSYDSAIVDGGQYLDKFNLTGSAVDGIYVETSVNGGSYFESASIEGAPNGGSYS